MAKLTLRDSALIMPYVLVLQASDELDGPIARLLLICENEGDAGVDAELVFEIPDDLVETAKATWAQLLTEDPDPHDFELFRPIDPIKDFTII